MRVLIVGHPTNPRRSPGDRGSLITLEDFNNPVILDVSALAVNMKCID